jgi:aryl-alcohol dehydrogenase-like predicted oxidoreductase
MKTKKLGWTELELTTIGLGTWAIGGGGWAYAWGPQDDQASIQAIHRALDLGINWIDTAAAYGLGHAEEIVGQAVAGLRQRPFIATKCGRSWNDKGQLVPLLKRKVILAEVEASLRRLKLDVIDLYQVHWPEPDADIEEAWTAIAECVKAGKIRYAGVSNFSVAQLQRVQPIHPVASLQPPYSMLARRAEQELLPYCAAQRIGVVAYSPMQKGLLTGKITRDRVRQLPPDDHRRRDSEFQEPLLSANLQLVEDLQSLASKHGRTVAQLAIAWVLRRPEVTSAIVGARHPSQVEEIVGAADWTLPQREIDIISDLIRKRHAGINQA